MFKTELPPTVILLLGVVFVLFGLYSLVVLPRKSVLEICKYELRLNNEEILYSDITSIDVKKGFFLKIVVSTASHQSVYQSIIFTHKEKKAIEEVQSFISSDLTSNKKSMNEEKFEVPLD